MKKTIILASNNEHKLVELREKLRPFEIEVMSQREAGYDIEVDETGTTFEENAELKAEAIFRLSHTPTIADDSGLMVDALGGQPGVYSHRFAGPNATDDDRINKLLGLLQDTPDEQRTARFRTAICYIDETGKKHIFEGTCEGTIGHEKKGENGFGFDPVFVYEGRTFAERSREEKNKVSHRGRAIGKFVEYIEEINKEAIR